MNKIEKIVAATCLLGYFLFFQAIHTINNTTNNKQLGFCIVKKITHYPCPSCGSTRAALLLFKGQFKQSVLTNPVGLLIALYLFIAPILLLINSCTSNKVLNIWYLKTEKTIKQPKVFISLIVLVILNWFWNIHKNL